jgi:methionyl-tRNA formyltransferase
MDDQMDHGPVVSSFKEEVKPDDTTETLRTRLFEHSAEFLLELLPSYLSGKINLKTQDHEQASFTTLLKKSDGYISPKFIDAALEGKVLDEEWEIKFIRNYSQKPTAQNIYNFVRAMHSWPNAWTEVSTGKETKRLKILSANLEPAVIASGARQSLVLNKVQLEGKNETTWDQLKLGYPSLSFQN